MDLRDRVAAIIGGATGIGSETACELASAGARVYIGDINDEGAERTAARCRETGAVAHAVHVDAAGDDSVAAFFRRIVEAEGGLDGVLLNAADLSPANLGRDTDAVDIDLAVWDHTLNVALRGTLLGIRHSVPLLLQRGGGAIVCTSSAAAVMGRSSRPAYSAAKAGVNALVRHAASRWGKDGIRVNAVAPGPVQTNLNFAGYSNEQWQADRLSSVRTPRIGLPGDVAKMVRYLLSDDAAFVTGQVIGVDGGYLLWPT